MLDWISEPIFRLIGWIPSWLLEDDTPKYYVVRGFLGLLLMVAIGVLLALWIGRKPGRESDQA